MRNTLLCSTFALLLFAGCDKDRDESSAKKEKTPRKGEKVVLREHQRHKDEDAQRALVAGKWTGRWESATHKGHGSGGLNCVVKEAAKHAWTAVFTAEFGKTKAYNVELDGTPAGDHVDFGGTIDLGKEDGGLFKWTGRATPREFSGTYEGGGDKGTFKMSPAPRDSSAQPSPAKSSPVQTRNGRGADDAHLSDEAKRDFIE